MSKIQLLKTVILLFLLVVLCIGVFYFYGNVTFYYVKKLPSDSIVLNSNVYLIHSEKNPLFKELKLNEYSVDFEQSTIMLSTGEVKNIRLKTKNKLLPIYTNFVEVYLKTLNQKEVYVYILPKNKVYFDERFSDKYYIKLP